MPRLYVLDVPEHEGVLKVADADPATDIDHVGPYWRITSAAPIVIDRRATGCRHAVWYSAVAGLEASAITQHDKNALRIEAR
jgi:hypothetical protein